MELSPYEFSKLLFYQFYKNHLKIYDWREFRNDFTNDSQKLVDDFYQFKAKSNEKLNELSGQKKEKIIEEYENLKRLKSEWKKFVDEFARIEDIFLNKYQMDAFLLEDFLSDKEKLREFLAEYSAYENMLTVYDSLLTVEIDLIKILNLGQAFEKQQQML